MRDLHGRDHDQRRQAVRQQVAEHDARLRQREAARRLDIFAPLLDQGGAAHGARVIGPLDDDERDDDLVDAAAEHGEQHERDEDRREGELQVDDAHDDRLDPPAGIGREHADRGADRAGDQDRDRADRSEMRRP